MSFAPMLAPRENPLQYPNFFKELQYPLDCSPKIDGIRCTVKRQEQLIVSSDFEAFVEPGDGPSICMSREFNELPSRQVQSLFSNFLHFDGELVAGDETAPNLLNYTQSFVTAVNKHCEDLSFRVFDCADEEIAGEPFEDRLAYAADQLEYYKKESGSTANVSIVQHERCRNYDELIVFEEKCLVLGYEGLMMRKPSGHYKWGRGTFKEGLIYKLKRFADFEAQVVGFIEEQTNTNILETDALGFAKRSSAKAGMVPAGTLGGLLINHNGEELVIGCGVMKKHERLYVFLHQEEFLMKWCTIRHFPHGQKDRPRLPRFAGWCGLLNKVKK